MHLPRLGWLDWTCCIALETSLAWKLLPALYFFFCSHVLLPSPSLAHVPHACGLNRHSQQEGWKQAPEISAWPLIACMYFPLFVNIFPDGKEQVHRHHQLHLPFLVPIKAIFALSYFAHTRAVCKFMFALHKAQLPITIRIAHVLYLILLGTYYETLRVPCFITLFNFKCNEMTLWINRSNRCKNQ